MSLILDALRRAERARDKDLTRRISEAGAPRLRIERRSWVPAGILGIAAAAIAVLLWPQPASDTDPVVRATTTTADAAPQSSAQPPVAIHARGSSLADIAMPDPRPETTLPGPRSPMFNELTAAQRATIPAISVDAHFWSEDPDRRFVILDMRRVRVGEEARPGLRVLDIDADSVELDWQGTRFRLPAR